MDTLLHINATLSMAGWGDLLLRENEHSKFSWQSIFFGLLRAKTFTMTKRRDYLGESVIYHRNDGKLQNCIPKTQIATKRHLRPKSHISLQFCHYILLEYSRLFLLALRAVRRL